MGFKTDENLAQLLDRVTFAEQWNRDRAEAHRKAAFLAEEDGDRQTAEVEYGRMSARRDAANTLSTIALSLTVNLGVSGDARRHVERCL